ncbi:MAG: NRDE family protein [Chitinophagaceae bacterium]
MCTVTFIPVEDKVYITHNRDERKSRSCAIPPAVYTVNGYHLLYPKDSKAGGTWIAINEIGNVAVLLNGGFVKHTPLASYRKSRGLVLLDIVATDDMLQAWKCNDLFNIEPFTLILYNKATLWECRWDGSQKHILELNPGQIQMWSSATLYDHGVMTKRKKWFADWHEVHPCPSLHDIMQFQRNAGEGDACNDLCMNRDGIMLTVSITSMQLTHRAGIMHYLDLRKDSSYKKKLTFIKAPVESQ